MSTTPAANIDTRFGDLRVRRVAGHIGGEVLGLKLSAELSTETFDHLYQALLAHKVLFIRGQKHLDDAAHQAFGQRFGRIVAHPTVPSPGGTKLFELDASRGGGRADSWHTDVTFVDAFPKVSILRGVTIPAYGGDTVWANTAQAYARLPEPLKRLAEQLWAVHSNDYDYGADRTDISADRQAHHDQVFVKAVCRPVSRSVCSTCCRRVPSGWRTRCAGSGSRTTWRSGTTAPRSTSRSTTLATSRAWGAA